MNIARSIIETLGGRGESLSVAESVTGGLLSAAFTQVAGASMVFAGGLVCYQNHAKIEVLGVREEDINELSAVSESVAIQMAEAVRRLLHTDYSLATTGVAGPGADDRGNPEGLVIIALASRKGMRIQRFELPESADAGEGLREAIQGACVQHALLMLQDELRSSS